MIITVLACPFNIFSNTPRKPIRPVLDPNRHSITEADTVTSDTQPVEFTETAIDTGAGDATLKLLDPAAADTPAPTVRIFNPDPTRAVWLSALCPGLGQLYNRRYWKLPLVVGGFMGLGYATSWNNGMLRDYTRAYADILDNDPSTRSYMDFFPSTTREEDLNMTWLANTFKSRKDYYRRNRDLCIICMVGVYLLAMVDAYVDAAMAHFDITPDLSMQIQPALIPDTRSRIPGVGLQWALNF